MYVSPTRAADLCRWALGKVDTHDNCTAMQATWANCQPKRGRHAVCGDPTDESVPPSEGNWTCPEGVWRQNVRSVSIYIYNRQPCMSGSYLHFLCAHYGFTYTVDGCIIDYIETHPYVFECSGQSQSPYRRIAVSSYRRIQRQTLNYSRHTYGCV